jgi:luciferase family oxidoreductase group 1
MLPHYSALKVAENFRMLETLFPGRIDLGIGRAPGSDRLTASLLNPGNTFNEQDFIEQLSDLQHYLNDSHEPGTPQSRVRATPLALSVPEQWILSSSGQSGLFAAHFGMAFSFAHFINPIGGPKAVRTYRERFKPSENLSQPLANVAIFVFCSESEEKVRQQQAIIDYRFIQFETKGRFDPVSYEDVQFASYSLAELERIRYNRQRVIVGTPDQLKARLTQLAKDYDVEEVMAVNITLDFEDRMHSFELLAEAFNLQKVNALS